MCPPGWRKDWLIGVMDSRTGKLFAFISAIPATLRVRDAEMRVAEVNFLCVHKKLRSRRLAPGAMLRERWVVPPGCCARKDASPFGHSSCCRVLPAVLIKEITRRVNLCDMWQAVYTAGVVIPKPVGTGRYYHRSLDPKKLIEVQFSRLSRNMTMARTIKLNKLPEVGAWAVRNPWGHESIGPQQLDVRHRILLMSRTLPVCACRRLPLRGCARCGGRTCRRWCSCSRRTWPSSRWRLR